jgi:hypothetical protein
MIIIHFKCEAGHTYELKSGILMADAAALGSHDEVKNAVMQRDAGIVDKFADWADGHDINPGDDDGPTPVGRSVCQAKVFVERIEYAD